MVLVVIGHVLMNCNPANGQTLLQNIIGTFYMPLFFLISGFFAFKQSSRWTSSILKKQFRNKVASLLICSIVFFTLLRYCQNQDIFGWINHGFGAYWFTICLFEMFMIYYFSVAVSILFKRDIILVLMVVVSLSGLVIMLKNPLSNHLLWTILGGSNLCLFLQYFTLGLFFRRYKDEALKLITRNWVITTLTIAWIVMLCIHLKGLSLPYLLDKIFSVIVLPYTALFFVVALFVVSKDYFEKDNHISNNLCIVGRRSLDVYMIHYFFLPALPVLSSLVSPNNMIFFQIAVGLTVSIPIITISVFIGSLLRKSETISSWIFGVNKSELTHTYNAK